MVSYTHLEMNSSLSLCLSRHTHTHKEEETGEEKTKTAPIWFSPVCPFLSVILQVWKKKNPRSGSHFSPIPYSWSGCVKVRLLFPATALPFRPSVAAVSSHEPSYGCSFRGTGGTLMEYLGEGAAWGGSELPVNHRCHLSPVTRWQRQMFSVKWPQSSSEKKEMEGFTASELI